MDLHSGAESLYVDLPSFGSSELDFFLKQESFPMDSLLKQDFSPVLPENLNLVQAQEEIPYSMNSPDSTQITVQNMVPCPTSKLPSKENYPGPYEFDIDLKKSPNARCKWEYSEGLNKIFVLMNSKVPLKFKWNQKAIGLYVRALPIFLAQDYFEEPVRRCASHSSRQEESNQGFEYVDHIIRCDNHHTVYDKNPQTERLSVVVPLDLPQPGADGTTVVYTFMCKNSCPVGMNRRSTGIIFTLEDERGNVFGRKLINIRICSCPRRDMAKEEADITINPTSSVAPAPPPGKKNLKRLKDPGTTNFNIRLPKVYAKPIAKIIKELISFQSVTDGRDLNQGELSALEDCNKYM